MTRALLALPLLFTACGPPRFSEVQDKVFTPSCVFSTCHDAAGGGGLVLTGSRAHAQLVGVPSVGAPTRTRVVAGDVANSYLVEKLSKAVPAAGALMPQGGDGLEADRLELIKAWIAAGAKND